jgi:hypothetical protein
MSSLVNTKLDISSRKELHDALRNPGHIAVPV